MENTGKVSKMIDLLVGIAGIIVTVISIIVTMISIWQTAKKSRHQKSNRRSAK